MRTLIFSSFMLIISPLAAQQPDSAATVLLPDSAAVAAALDSAGPAAPVKKTGFFSKNYPNPRKAALMSLVLPGSGQAYNKKWWKLPIVYATLGGLTWLEVSNIRNYREARDNYLWLVDGDPTTNVEPYYEGADATSLRQYRDILQRYVEQSSLALGLAYLLTATDAFVDAHLTTFDVSDDISLRLSPSAQNAPGLGTAFGVGLRLQFGAKRDQRPLANPFGQTFP